MKLKEIPKILIAIFYVYCLLAPVVTLLYLILLPYYKHEDSFEVTLKQFNIDKAFGLKHIKKLFKAFK